MANNFTPVGNEVQVNLAPNQNVDQFDPDIAVLTDGRFFVAFGDDDRATAMLSGSSSTPTARSSGGNIDIDIGAGDQANPAVAQRARRRRQSWSGSDGASDDIQYSIVSSAGVAGPEQTILADADPVRLRRMSPRLPTAARWWLPQSRQSPLDEDIVFRFIDAAGAPSGAFRSSSITVRATSSTQRSRPSATMPSSSTRRRHRSTSFISRRGSSMGPASRPKLSLRTRQDFLSLPTWRL